MVTVADLFAGINVNPNRLHRSRASLRRPQWGLFRDELNSRTWPRFNARIMPIRANIVGAAKIGNQEPLPWPPAIRRHRARPWEAR
jgi:hypothetical protein